MFFACINPKSPSVVNKKLFGVKWIQFIDSGGQLQYHDILPLFIQDPVVTIFVLKLSEELSHHPTIEYYGADGKLEAPRPKKKKNINYPKLNRTVNANQARPGCILPTPQTNTTVQILLLGIHVAVAGFELSECILRSTVATRVHGIAKKDGRGV